MRFGILIHTLHAHRLGTINLLPVNLKIIVIMNQNLEHVKVFIQEVRPLFHFKELISSSFFLGNNRALQQGFFGKIKGEMSCCLGDF